MAQEIKQGNVFGRIGSGIGQGLAEQVPKEVDRYRLKQGLEELGNQKGLSPFQQFTQLASTPGITPQMIQSGTELLRQQARGQSLSKVESSEKKPSPFPVQKNKSTNEDGIPSITKEEPLAEIQEGYIPPTQDEIFEDAGRRYNENPELYNNDPQQAIDAAEKDAVRKENINLAYQKQHQNLTDIQDKVILRLKEHSDKLGVNVPANQFSLIEDKAIKATKPKKDGGEGLTEQQAIKKYGNELDQLSRDYSTLDSVGNWGITARSGKETLRSLKSTQEDFEKRNDTENMADTLISNQKLSPAVAYSIAQPVSKVPEANKILRELPSLFSPYEPSIRPSPRISIPKTLDIIPRLAELLSKDEKLSPLSVAYELDKKGYDGDTWLEYVTNHQNEINMKSNQARQLKKPRNALGTWNDWWLSSWTGL